MDLNAAITVNGNPVNSGSPSGLIGLSVGTNVISVAVVSANTAVTNNYALTVTRIAPNSNASLVSFSLKR